MWITCNIKLSQINNKASLHTWQTKKSFRNIIVDIVQYITVCCFEIFEIKLIDVEFGEQVRSNDKSYVVLTCAFTLEGSFIPWGVNTHIFTFKILQKSTLLIAKYLVGTFMFWDVITHVCTFCVNPSNY